MLKLSQDSQTFGVNRKSVKIILDIKPNVVYNILHKRKTKQTKPNKTKF